MRLTGPSLTATSGVTLGGATVGDGWMGKSEGVHLAGGLQVPAGSAALVWLAP
jgi:hypothetical protein